MAPPLGIAAFGHVHNDPAYPCPRDPPPPHAAADYALRCRP